MTLLEVKVIRLMLKMACSIVSEVNNSKYSAKDFTKVNVNVYILER